MMEEGKNEVSGTDKEENVKWHVGLPQMTSIASKSRVSRFWRRQGPIHGHLIFCLGVDPFSILSPI